MNKEQHALSIAQLKSRFEELTQSRALKKNVVSYFKRNRNIRFYAYLSEMHHAGSRPYWRAVVERVEQDFQRGNPDPSKNNHIISVHNDLLSMNFVTKDGKPFFQDPSLPDLIFNCDRYSVTAFFHGRDKQVNIQYSCDNKTIYSLWFPCEKENPQVKTYCQFLIDVVIPKL